MWIKAIPVGGGYMSLRNPLAASAAGAMTTGGGNDHRQLAVDSGQQTRPGKRISSESA